MRTRGHFRPNSPPVLQETLDDETIAVDLDTGTYYSMRGSAAYVWRLLESGASTEAAAAALMAFYDLDHARAETVVDELLSTLLSEGLLLPADLAPVEGPTAVTPPASRAYEDPSVSKYTDMQELLLLDPVHDVDETGWPAVR